MNTTSCVDPYLSARKASNRNDHFLLEFVIFRPEINEQINRRNEKRRENRLNVLLEFEVSAANYYLLLHGRAAVMIGLFIWDPLLYTLIQMRTSLTGPLLFRTRKKKKVVRKKDTRKPF